MHILLTVNSTWNILNFRKGLIKEFLRQGHKVTLLSPADKGVETLRALGCQNIDIEIDNHGLNPIKDLALVNRFRKVFMSEKPDIVFSFTIKNNIFGAIAARFTNTVFVPNITGLGTAFLSKKILKKVVELLYRQAFKKVHTVFFQNSEDFELFLARQLVDPKRAELLPGSGIDLDEFSVSEYSKDSKSVTFLMISRLLKEKGIAEYIAAAEIVKSKNPNVRFQNLGGFSDNTKSAISPDLIEAGVGEGIIEYLGECDDVRPYIEKAHCVVLPSYREGAPRALIEAAAMGRPIITTNVAGCRSVVDDGKSGILCEPQDAKSLASACERFIALSHSEKEKMGQSGRTKMVKEFDEKIVIDAYLKIVNETRTTVRNTGE